MKDIRIFVASSKELERERNYLAFLVLAKEDEFAERGLRVRLSKWEYVDPRMTEARTEDRYLDEMHNCDAALILFRNIAGEYTREELGSALSSEQSDFSRLKVHRLLFAADGKPCSDAAKLRESLPPDSYGVWSGMADLRAAFLSLVDRAAHCEGLVDAREEALRTVSAFLAADDELAADRNAFADTVLNLNDILSRRGVRVKMRFYDAARHREMLESSEMALVLYHTNCNVFGPGQMRDAYDRTRREENPRRLYVFFRDEDDAGLDKSFVDFKNGFAENLGHFFCRFENADTLKLNFLLSLENLLGEGESFVKLDGTKVKADELEVGELTSLPMVANNGGLNDLIARAEQAASEFKAQQAVCRANPSDDSAYDKLLSLSKRKNDLDGEVEKELALSLKLAKRMAGLAVSEANDAILRARLKMEAGEIREALEILDGASSEVKSTRSRLLRRAVSRADEEEEDVKALRAGCEVEMFRVDAIMAFAECPFKERFDKAETLCSEIVADLEEYAKVCSARNVCTVNLLLAKALLQFSCLYDVIGDTLKPIPLLEKALKFYRASGVIEGGEAGFQYDVLGVLIRQGRLFHEQNLLDDADMKYREALEFLRGMEAAGHESFSDIDVATVLNNLGLLHVNMNRLKDAERELGESLGIFRRLAKESLRDVDEFVAMVLNNLGLLYASLNQLAESERAYGESLATYRRLAEKNSEKFDECVARGLLNRGLFHIGVNQFEDAEGECQEALVIYRHLAGTNPEKFDEYEARSLNCLGQVHASKNCLDDAEREYTESLCTFRRLAEANPKKFDEYLAVSLFGLAQVHASKNCLDDAEQEYTESLDTFRRLAEANPEKFDECVADVLSGLGLLHVSRNCLADAEREYTESLAVCRHLAEVNPEKFDECVAVMLRNLGGIHASRNRLDDAEREYTESLDIFRRLAEASPEKFCCQVAAGLDGLASFHGSINHLEAAEDEYNEALAIMRRLAEENPKAFAGSVAALLHNLAGIHMATNRQESAEQELAEALATYRNLAASNHEMFDEDVASTLDYLATFQRGMNCVGEAERAYGESLGIYRRLAEANPDKYDECVARGVFNLGSLHYSMNRFAEAEREYGESLEILRRLAMENPEKYAAAVADAEAALKECHK